MSHKRTLLIAIALGFAGGFFFVSVASGGSIGTAAQAPESTYSAAG